MSQVHVLGAGSLGLLFAYHLRASGRQVTLLLRSQAQVDAFHRQGSRVHLVPMHRGLPSPDLLSSEQLNAASMCGTTLLGPISHLVVATKVSKADTARQA